MSNFGDLLGNGSHKQYLGRWWVLPRGELLGKGAPGVRSPPGDKRLPALSEAWLVSCFLHLSMLLIVRCQKATTIFFVLIS